MFPLLKALKMCWNVLPLDYRVLAKEAPDVARLDYPGHDLYIHVTSNADIDRANSCRKEPGTVQWIEQDVSGVFFDIGANVGAYSLVAWARFRERAGSSGSPRRIKVYAFEPGFSTFPQLCRNILLNGCGDAIVPLNLALSDKSELREFRYARLESGAASHLGLSRDGGHAQENSPDVAFTQPMWVHSLDDAIIKFRLPQPNHVKIDVDGHELAILRGAEATLKSVELRSLQVEVGEHDVNGPLIRALLESHGFSVTRIAQHPSGPIADYVFSRTSPANSGARFS